MNIFNNIIPSADANSGSASAGVKTASNNAKEVTADGKSVSAAADGDSAPLFQLLLGQVAPKSAPAASSTVTTDTDKSPAATTADTTVPADLNLFIALLPALAPAQTASPTSAADSATATAPVTPTTVTPLPTLTLADPKNAADTALPSPMSALISETATALSKDNAPAPKLELAAAMLQAAQSATSAVTAPAAPTQTQATDSTAATTVRVDVPMHYPEWPEAVGHRLLWAVNDGIQKAELHVNPEHLGPVHVKIHLDNDKADIQFAAVTPQAREALETSIPKLREMFAQQGLDLHQAQVFSQTSQNPNGRSPSSSASPFQTTMSGEGADETPAVPIRAPRQSLRLLDDYA